MYLVALPRPLRPSNLCNEDEVRGAHPWHVLHQLPRQLLQTVRLQVMPLLVLSDDTNPGSGVAGICSALMLGKLAVALTCFHAEQFLFNHTSAIPVQ